MLSLAISCYRRLLLAIAGYLWLPQVISGYIWLSLATSDCLGLYWTIFVYLGLFQAYLGLSRAISGYLMLSHAISGYLVLFADECDGTYLVSNYIMYTQRFIKRWCPPKNCLNRDFDDKLPKMRMSSKIEDTCAKWLFE